MSTPKNHPPAKHSTQTPNQDPPPAPSPPLPIPPSSFPPTSLDLPALTEKAHDFAQAGIADNTRRAYKSDWRHFSSWCDQRNLAPLPAESSTVVLYLTDLTEEGKKISTLRRRLSTIAQAHRTANYPTPTTDEKVRAVFRGIRREKGVAQQKKAALLTQDLRNMVVCLPERLLGIRDKALLLIGFAGGFRRSELVALDVEDLEFCPEGLVINVRRSKTDQEGEGRKVGIPWGQHTITCPVKALQSWLHEGNITEGAIFRPLTRHKQILSSRLTAQSVAKVVKRCAKSAGLDPNLYSGHSLRAGLVTSAAMADVSENIIMRQTGHRSSETLRSYIREGDLFQKNVLPWLGL